jgi:hypothetical protein
LAGADDEFPFLVLCCNASWLLFLDQIVVVVKSLLQGFGIVVLVAPFAGFLWKDDD